MTHWLGLQMLSTSSLQILTRSFLSGLMANIVHDACQQKYGETVGNLIGEDRTMLRILSKVIDSWRSLLRFEANALVEVPDLGIGRPIAILFGE